MNGSVLVIEDDPDIAEIIRHGLDRAGYGISVARTGRQGVAEAERSRPRTILLDLDLPDVDGLDLVSRLSEIAPVIVLTGRTSESSIVSGLERGADDYVTKPFSPRVLAARIEAVSRRGQPQATSRLDHGSLVIDLDRRVVLLEGDELELTRRELDLLAHLASRPDTVVSREELLRAVWRSSAEWQGVATVTEHVRRIRLKLGDPGWIVSVRGVGYRFRAVG